MISHEHLMAFLEALVFVSKEPIQAKQVEEAFERKGEPLEAGLVLNAMEALKDKWEALSQTGGFELLWVGGGLLFRTKPEHASYLQAFFQEKPQKLSNAQLETLAIIAYRQPITRLEVEQVRGVDSAQNVRKLLSLKLVKILGKSEGLGRPLLYGTTKQFLEFFGLNSLHDLPSLKEYQDLNKDEKPAPLEEDSIGTIRDLFAQEPLIDAHKEEKSEKALKALEEALSAVSSVSIQVDTEVN